MTRLFGTDGIRGVANKEISSELAFKIGKAITQYFRGGKGNKPSILIGRDTRKSGKMLEASLAAGICSSGGNAISLGIAPTPAVAFLVKNKKNINVGVVISASHNKFHDNGIKIFAKNGYKISDHIEDELEKLIFSNLFYYPTGKDLGEYKENKNLLQIYINFILNSISIKLEKIKIVLDCANGAAYKIAPKIFKKLGAQVIVINNKPNGININDNCGSTNLKQLQEAVMSYKADIGIAYDGDADRCIAIDETGDIVNGDKIMLICAESLLKENKLPGKGLVTTVMSNIGMRSTFRNKGVNLEITPVGDRHVIERMLEKNYIIGGEQSGHIIFSNLSTTGDGILTSIQLMAILKKTEMPISKLANCMIEYPQILKNVYIKSNINWQDNITLKMIIKNIEEKLGNKGRILLRKSGTEPVLRIMIEGYNIKTIEKYANQIASVIEKENI